MNPILAIFLCLAGVVLLVLAVLFRLGRQPWARDWVHGDDEHIGRILLMLPAGGAGLLAGGVVAWADENLVAGMVLLIAMPTALVLGLWNMFSFRVPLWFLPAWSRDSVGPRRAAEEKGKKERKRAR